MSWLEKLYQTYERCASAVGDPNDVIPLLPVSHTIQNAQIEIVIDELGVFKRARLIPRSNAATVIPCTEASGGRSGPKPTCHPLADKLQYLAGDFLRVGGEVTSGFAKDPAVPHQTYLELLADWCASPFRHPKVELIQSYVRKGTIMADLFAAGILPRDAASGSILKEWTGAAADAPGIFAVMAGEALPEEAFVRWLVEIPDDPQSELWNDRSVWKGWSDYYMSTKAARGLCYVTGNSVRLATQHPAKLRNAADKAKLISANDSSGFTFRGRFTDTDGSQVCGVGFDVTQKAHNVLRWLIARQGRRDGTQAIVAWSVAGGKLPDLFGDSRSLLLASEDRSASDVAESSPAPLPDGDVAQHFALRLRRKVGGYKADLRDAAGIVVLALDSATPGRMSITYYRELAASELLARIEKWHAECAWFQNFQGTQFVGAPAPHDIVQAAYGSRSDTKKKLLAGTIRRLLPCIIDGLPIPRDIVESCVRRASSRNGIANWEWEKALGIACALYRNHTINNKNYQMSLEPNRTTRDYLYGRLLAIAERIENYSLHLAGEHRETNAARLMQRFADNPYSTWRTIETALVPYKTRLRNLRPPFLLVMERELDSVMTLFESADFISPAKLTGEFLLGYHCQRSALWRKAAEDDPSEENDDQK